MKIVNMIFTEQADLKTIYVPTLIIEGKHDVFLKMKTIEKQAKNNKNIVFKKIEGIHRLMYKEKLEVIKKVRSFIEK